jgi:hypothetical protein
MRKQYRFVHRFGPTGKRLLWRSVEIDPTGMVEFISVSGDWFWGGEETMFPAVLVKYRVHWSRVIEYAGAFEEVRELEQNRIRAQLLEISRTSYEAGIRRKLLEHAVDQVFGRRYEGP